MKGGSTKQDAPAPETASETLEKCPPEVECGTDGKYAKYAIVPSVFSVAFAVMGVQYSAGVMYGAFLGAFGESEEKTAWVPAIAIGMLMLSMGPAGYLQGMIGNRMLVILGGLMATLGLLLSSFTTEMWQIFLTYSVLCSIGQGFAYLGAVNGTWFSKPERAMAMALASSGSGFGTATLGPITVTIVDHGPDSWKWAMRLLALVSLFLICGAGLLMKPEPSGLLKEAPPKAPIMDVLKHGKLMYFCLVLLVLGLGIWNSQVHNVEVVQTKGFSSDASTYYNLFGFALGAVLGRPIAATVTTEYTGKRPGFVIICALLALFAGVFPAMDDEGWKILINNFFYGWAFGAWISILPSMCVEIVGMKLFEVALGVVYAAPGITMMVGPPICTWIKNAEGNFDHSYYFSGAVMGLAGIMAIPMCYWPNAMAQPENTQQPEAKDTVKQENPLAAPSHIIDENDPEMGKSNEDRSPKHKVGSKEDAKDEGITI